MKKLEKWQRRRRLDISQRAGEQPRLCASRTNIYIGNPNANKKAISTLISVGQNSVVTKQVLESHTLAK